VSRARNYDTVIFCLANTNSREVLQALEGFEGRLIVVSTLSPVHLAAVPWVETAVAVYGTAADSFAAGFAAMAGDFEPVGRLPIHVP
jgi:beta-N-acetylhexosaminidase